jgi:hypothetical protein
MKVWAMTTIATQPRRLSGWRPSAAALGLALSCLAPAAAWAQLNSIVPGGSRGSPIQSHTPDKPAVAEPDSVPGAKAREPAAPPTHAAGDMQPNDALFDAINRGDIAAARDALNRGADMNAVNILGMTPMELSVDLGRNDISFLLLSMRGEDSDRGARAVGRDVPAPKSKAPARIAATAKPSGRTKAIDSPVATKPIAVPKLFANDGGTPQPNAGFLGFDARSATN